MQKKNKKKEKGLFAVCFMLVLVMFIAGNTIHLEEKNLFQMSVFASAQTGSQEPQEALLEIKVPGTDTAEQVGAGLVEVGAVKASTYQPAEGSNPLDTLLRRESNIVKEENKTIEAYYPVTGNTRMDQDIQATINTITRQFEEGTADNNGSKELKVDYSAFLTQDNRLSIVFSIQQNVQGQNLADRIVTSLYRMDTGRRLYLEDLLAGNYLEEVSKYIRSNFRQSEEYRNAVNEPSFTAYTEPVAENFQVFSIDNEKIDFYFQKGELLNAKYDMVTVEMSLDRLQDYWKDPGSDLFEPVVEAMPEEPQVPEVPAEPEQPAEEPGNDPSGAVIDPSKPMVALTFDDGPHETRTAMILDALEENHAKATFFVLGNRVGRSPEALKRAVSLGCEIGNHSYSHLQLTKLSIEDIQYQVNETNRLVEEITGVAPVLLRPPYGALNDTVRQTVGMPMALWSIDTLDWKTKSRDKTVSTILDNIQDGDIVLMHDIHEASTEAAQIIIPELIKRGYQLVTVSELAQYRNVELQAGSSYGKFRP